MSVREMLNKNRPLVIVAVVLAVCGAGWATYYQLKPAARGPMSTGVWFIPEDKTSFEDCVVVTMDTVPPTQRDGKTLVKAFVLDVNGQKRVLYMKKLTDKAAQSMEAVKKKGGMPIQTAVDMNVASLLVKRPGDTEWVSMMSKQGGAIIREASNTKGEDIPAIQ